MTFVGRLLAQRPLGAAGVFASRCRVVVDVSWWCLCFYLVQCEAEDWKICLQLFPVPRVRCVYLHAELLFSSNDEICADNYIFLPVQVAGLCRSEKWELFLYGDMTIKVDCA